jgi:hypothetical protein
MSWKDVLKAHCGTERMETEDEEEERKSEDIGPFKMPDMSFITDITDRKIKRDILREIEKEGGALGMKNLKKIANEKDLKRVLSMMEEEGEVFMHEDGDIYTHEPKK